jgi:hypothetical protein
VGAAMNHSMVMTRCPSTGHEIATGIACDWVTFNNRVAGYSDRIFNWARKTRRPLPSTPSRSSAASRLRATTSGVTLAGRKERLTGCERQLPRLLSCRRHIGDKAIEDAGSR